MYNFLYKVSSYIRSFEESVSKTALFPLFDIVISRPFCTACVQSWKVNSFPELAYVDVH